MTGSAERLETVAEPKRGTLVLLIVLVGAIWFSSLEYRKLTRPDEGRYAEIARGMAINISPRCRTGITFRKVSGNLAE